MNINYFKMVIFGGGDHNRLLALLFLFPLTMVVTPRYSSSSDYLTELALKF